MKRVLSICVLLLFGFRLFAQQTAFPSNSEQVIKQSKHLAFWRFKDPKTVAEKLTQNLKTDEEKALAIASWICNNIRYDYRSFKKYRATFRTNSKILRKGKALCGGYAALYQEMCESVNIPCETVVGYVKNRYFVTGDSLYWCEHAWNTVNINGNWYLLDLTWAGGYETPRMQRIRRFLWRKFRLPFRLKYKWVKDFNLHWLYVHPDSFIYSHHPAVSDFQLRSPAFSIGTFYQGNDSLIDFINKKPSQKVNYQLDKFSGLGEYSKQIYLAEKAPFTNGLNRNVVGNFYYNAFFEKLNYFYDFEENITSNDIIALKELDSIAQLAEQHINLGFEDVRTNYLNQGNRNLAWKQERSARNLAKTVKIRGLLSSKNITQRLRYRHYGRSRSILIKYKSINKSLASVEKHNIRRPLSKREKAPDSLVYKHTLAIELHKLDSIKESLDSLLKPNYYGQSKALLKAMKRHTKDIDYANRLTRFFYINSFLYAPFVHQNDFFVKKEVLQLEIDSLIQFQFDTMQQLTHTQDTFINAYYLSQIAYRTQLLKVIRFCELNKKQSFDDFGEDFTINELVLQNQDFIKKHFYYFDSLIRYQRPIAQNIKRQNKLLIKGLKELRFDNGVENMRYNKLKSHLNLERGYRNYGLKYMQNHLKTYHEAVKRGIEEYEKNLPN